MMKLFKQLKTFLVIVGSIALTILISSQLAQATVTNGNIRYFEGEKEVSESFSTSETSSTTSSSTTTMTSDTGTESSATTETTDSTDTDSTSAGSGSTTTSTSSEDVIIKPSGSSGTGDFLKTNDTVNYIFVVVGVIFVLIAVYNLKKT